MWTPRAIPRRVLGVSIPLWHATQRFESPAPALETGRCEDRRPMAQLAHFEADSRYIVAGAGSFLKGCAGATRSQQDVHDARDLQVPIPAHLRVAVENLSQLVTNGDEFGPSAEETPTTVQ
jgi:hypothetical protein